MKDSNSIRHCEILKQVQDDMTVPSTSGAKGADAAKRVLRPCFRNEMKVRGCHVVTGEGILVGKEVSKNLALNDSFLPSCHVDNNRVIAECGAYPRSKINDVVEYRSRVSQASRDDMKCVFTLVGEKVSLDCHGVNTPRNDESNEILRLVRHTEALAEVSHNSAQNDGVVLASSSTLDHSFKKPAFTLAEVLITLGIIGVVAAITLPALITNIQDRIKEKRVQNIQQKFSKATDKMLSISGLNGYESTLDFVNELKNHLSIAKICENDELRNCWPTEKVTLADGKEWEISKTKTGKTLKMKNDAEHEWSDTVGLITGDGTSMILSYNTKCDIEPTATSNWTSDKSSSTGCIAAVFDWNGSSKPNMFGTFGSDGKVPLKADVLTLNALGLGQACAFETSEGKCLSPIQSTTGYLTKNECEAEKGALGINNCYFDTDYWAWAVKECGGVTKMASMEDLAEIASKIYGTTITAYKDLSSSAGKTYDTAIASSLGLNLPSAGFYVWSGREYNSSNAYYRDFSSSNSCWGTNYNRAASSGLFLCKE